MGDGTGRTVRIAAMAAVLAMPMATGGCISTATTIVKAPFQVAGKGVSWATGGRKRADRREGRRLRHEDERAGRDDRLRRERCAARPDDPACTVPTAPPTATPSDAPVDGGR